MNPLAVGELSDAFRTRGTAFAVDRATLITCWHCVTGRDGEPVSGPFSVRLGADTVLSATYVDHDPLLDVALLSLGPAHELPADWQPLPLDSTGDTPTGSRVEALGWAFRNPSTVEPQTMPAEIAVPQTSIQDGVPVVQLFSSQVAAGLRPKGFSGGPVVAATLAGPVAVGVVRWAQVEESDPTRATGGTVYASRVQDIVRRWPRLAPVRPAPEVLAGDPGSPSRTLVTHFLDTHLNGPGGRLPFAGRRSALDALDAWLTDPGASPYHLVTGGAGTGKSTLLSRWAESLAQRADPATHLVFFPVSLRHDSAGLGPVVRALVHRVARVHNQPYDPTAGVETLRDTLSQLLARPAPVGSTLLVLVDALDEADGWRTANALHLPRSPGERVRIVLTARHTRQRPTVRNWLRALELDTGSASTVLTAFDENTVRELLHQTLPGRGGAVADALEAAAPHLLRLTRGDPVTTALYLQDLRLRPDQDLDRWVARLRHARPGLEGFMDRWWREQRRLWEGRTAPAGRVDDDARSLYSLLALARGPLSEGELRLLVGRVLDAKVSGDRVREGLELLDRFTLPGPGQATVALAHPLLAELRVRQLRDSDELNTYRQVFTDWGRQTLGDLQNGGLTPAGVPGYLARHLVQHLVPDPGSGIEPDAADAPEHFTDALRLVDPRWRRVREELDDDLDGYRRDVGRVAAACRRTNQSAFEAGLPLPRLSEQVLCAAVRAGEHTALSDEMTPALAAQLVRHGLWRRGRALAYLASLETLRSYDCVMGFAHLAPFAEEHDLPELRRLLVRLEHRYPEELAEATAAYTRRLLELGRPDDAVAEAHWLAERPARSAYTVEKGHERPRHEHRAFVRVWALGELIPDLPDEQARTALFQALREPVEDRETRYAVCHLTKHVTRRRAEELWPPAPYEQLPDWVTARFTEGELALPSDGPTGIYGPVEVLIAALDGKNSSRSLPFLAGAGHVNCRGYVAGARWLDERTRGELLHVALGSDDARSLLLDVPPTLYYDGLMDVVPARYAAWAAERIGDRMTGPSRTRALAQLLPVLEGEARQRRAEDIFARSEDFTERRWSAGGRSWDIQHIYAPAFAAAGYTDRILDLVEADALDAADGWISGLAPGLTLPATERALALTTPDPDRRAARPPRRHVLPRLASFGPDRAARALALVYDQVEPEGMPGEVRWLLDRFLPAGGHQATGRSSYAEVWWEAGELVGPGIVPVYESGVRSCPVRPRPGAELPADGPKVAGPQEFLESAYLIASALSEPEVPELLDLAAGTADPWMRVTLLAAGTHLPSGAGYDRILTAILTALAELRQETLDSRASPRDEGFPAHCPWLVRGTGDWAPFFSRLLAPRARPAVKELLFDGGFLDGVERTHQDPWGGEEHQRIDDWAYRLQPLTPLLDRAELDAVSASVNRIRSTTTRVSLRAALAGCYAALGEYDQAFELCRRLSWQNDDFLRHALADIAVAAPAELIPRWAAEIHRDFRDAKARGPMWQVIDDRWPELDRDALWRMFDQWTSVLPHDSTYGVYADALFYRYAMVHLGGENEPRRLLDLIDRTIQGTGRPAHGVDDRQ